MKRVVAVLMVLTLVVGPVALARPGTAGAASTMTIVTKERGSVGAPIPHACYAVSDVDKGGGVAGGCDEDGDGTTVLTTTGDGCSNCRIGQGLPDDPDTGLPTEYVLEPAQFGSFGGTYTFRNFYKPYVVVSAVDARSGNLVRGACVVVADVDRGSGVGGCDGAPSDRDGLRNGKIQTVRLTNVNYLDGTGNYRVDQKSPAPAGYVLGASVSFVADPALPGRFEAVTVKLPRAPRIRITTVDAGTGARLKGACYNIADSSHGGGLGKHCDGQLVNGFGDQDGLRNGVVVTKTLPVGHTYLIDQATAPAGYRLAVADKSVTTVAGRDAAATFQNRPAS